MRGARRCVRQKGDEPEHPERRRERLTFPSSSRTSTGVVCDSTRKDVASAADSLDTKIRVVERRLFNTRTTGRGQDLIRWPMRLAEQLEYLVGSVQSSDHAPTAAQREVGQLLRNQLQAIRALYDRVMSGDVAAFNAMLQQRRIPNVIISN